MTEPSEKTSGKTMPMTEWLSLMLAEIDRKDVEARAATDERQRRDTNGVPPERPDSTDVT